MSNFLITMICIGIMTIVCSLMLYRARYKTQRILNDPNTAKYVVVKPILINPDDPHQEPIDDHEARDLVNVSDGNDRIMASPDDFPIVGELITENDFTVIECNYTDEQGFGTAPFAHRI